MNTNAIVFSGWEIRKEEIDGYDEAGYVIYFNGAKVHASFDYDEAVRMMGRACASADPDIFLGKKKL